MRIDKAKIKEIIDEELTTLEGIDIAQPVPDGGTMPTRLHPRDKPTAPSEMEKFLNKAADVTPIVGGVRGIHAAVTDPDASTGEKVSRSALAVAGEIPMFKGWRLGTKIAGEVAHDQITTAADKAISKVARTPASTATAALTPKATRTGQPVGPGGLPKVSEGTKSIDLIKKLVEQELREINGGIMDPNMVPFVPHREPAADPPKESDEEDTEVDRLYRIAVKARLATEALVKALDDPIHDQAYDSAFKATMALRDTLNSLIDQGAQPTDSERLVAPHEEDQPRQDAPGYAIPFAGITYSGDNV